MNARLANLTLLFLLLSQISSGLWGFFSNQNPLAFDVHRYVAAALLIVLVFKARNVAPSLRRQIGGRGLRRDTYLSLFLAVLLAALLVFGLLWFFGLVPLYILGSVTPLDLHIWIGLALAIPLFIHVIQRLPSPRMRAPLGRRQAIKLLALGAAGVALWQATVLVGALTNPPNVRRFTGSRQFGSFTTCYPATTWLFSGAEPIDINTWTLTIRGRIEREMVLTYADLAGDGVSTTAILDCTSGWYAQLNWEGVAVGPLLERARLAPGAAQVIFRSVSGHNATLPLDEASRAILATRAQGQTLTHEHGFPLRLVAPRRWGFQWIKWLSELEVV